MEIEAIKNFPICPDGMRTFEMAAGARLNVSAQLGEGLVKAGLAKAVGQEPAAEDDNPFLEPEAEEPEVKAVRKPRENKDAGSRSRRS